MNDQNNQKRQLCTRIKGTCFFEVDFCRGTQKRGERGIWLGDLAKIPAWYMRISMAVLGAKKTNRSRTARERLRRSGGPLAREEACCCQIGGGVAQVLVHISTTRVHFGYRVFEPQPNRHKAKSARSKWPMGQKPGYFAVNIPIQPLK